MYNPDDVSYPGLLEEIRQILDSTPYSLAHSEIAIGRLRDLFDGPRYKNLVAIDQAYATRPYLGTDEHSWAERNFCVGDHEIKTQIEKLYQQANLGESPHLGPDPNSSDQSSFFLSELLAMARYIRSESFRRGSDFRAGLILKALGAQRNPHT